MNDKNSQDTDEFAKQIGQSVIENIVKNSGFNSAMFQQEKPLHIAWIITPVITYFVICALLLWVVDKGTSLYLFIFIAGTLTAAWIASATHKKANSKTITTIIGLAAFVGLLVAGGVTTPEETANKVDNYLR